MNHPIEYVGFDDLDLSDFDAETTKAHIASLAEHLYAEGKLKVHVSKHQHEGAKPKYAVHLFFDHGGHKHTSDKHHGWELGIVLKEAFKALEIQVEKEQTKHERR